MPDKEGVETVQDIRRLHPNTKIIVMSGSGLSDHYLKVATKFGAHATLGKPFRAAELSEIVGRVWVLCHKE